MSLPKLEDASFVLVLEAEALGCVFEDDGVALTNATDPQLATDRGHETLSGLHTYALQVLGATVRSL